MPYFQNIWDAEFQGNLLLSDRQFNMTFRVKGNSPNSSQLMQAWNTGPFNVSSPNNVLTLNYSFDAGNTFTVLTIDLAAAITTAGGTPSAATAYDIVNALNANSTFNALLTAQVNSDPKGNLYVQIQAIRGREKFKLYISNGGAESILRFNKKAGVAEFPTYFARHTIANKIYYPDSVGMLQQLDPTTATGQQIISEAGFSYSVGVTNSSTTVTIANTAPFVVGDAVVIYDGTTTLSTTISSITANTSLTIGTNWTGSTEKATLIDVHADYQLLRGRSGIFNFQNITVDASDRITQIIEYPAGTLVGDLARKINYVYSGSNTQPSQITEIPYTLTSNDLVHP